MCAARRQRGVALHMMTAPRLGVSLFNKGKKEKEEAERRCGAYDDFPEAWCKSFLEGNKRKRGGREALLCI
jgi:hypothetical protein